MNEQDTDLDIIRKESEIKIAGYLEFVATVQVIDEEFNRMATKSRLSGDASTFVKAVVARENAIGSARKSLLIGPETPKEIDTVLREAGYDPDEIGAQMKAAAEQALANSAANDILLETRPSEEQGCTCDACLDIIRKEIEDEG